MTNRHASQSPVSTSHTASRDHFSTTHDSVKGRRAARNDGEPSSTSVRHSVRSDNRNTKPKSSRHKDGPSDPTNGQGDRPRSGQRKRTNESRRVAYESLEKAYDENELRIHQLERMVDQLTDQLESN